MYSTRFGYWIREGLKVSEITWGAGPQALLDTQIPYPSYEGALLAQVTNE